MSTSRTQTTDIIEYSDDDEVPLSRCSWMMPSHHSESTNTCFRPPIDENAKELKKPLVQGRGISVEPEKMKNCEFTYFPGVLFGKRIKLH